MHYVADAEGSSWAGVVRLLAGFLPPAGALQQQGAGPAGRGGGAGAGGGPQQPAAPAGFQSVQAGSRVLFCVALWNALPVDVPLAGAELALRDDRGSFSVPLADADVAALIARSRQSAEGPRSSSRSSSISGEAAAAEAEAGGGAAPLSPPALAPGGWRRLVASVPVRCAGALTATWVKLSFGPGASLALRLGAGPGAGASQQAVAGPSASSPLPPFPAATG